MRFKFCYSLSQNSFRTPQDFEKLFKAYFEPLVNFINKYLNDHEVSRDVVQSTFLKLWKNRGEIEIKTSIKSYLYQMAKNTMLEHIKKQKLKQTESLDDSVVEKVMDSNIEEFDAFIVRSIIENSLKSVKEKSREIFILNKFEGLSYDEIADFLKISKRMVDYNVGVVLKHLRTSLKNHPDLFN